MTWQVADTRPAPMPQLESLPPVSRMLVALGFTLAKWQSRRRSRRALSLLDERMLDDIGLNRTLRSDEVGKPFWRA